jgi:hypothetical protein
MAAIPGPGNGLPSNPIEGTDGDEAALTGTSNVGTGVLGKSVGFVPGNPSGPAIVHSVAQPPGIGVRGISGAGSGHPSPTGAGVCGESDTANGVYGSSATWNGVEGESWSPLHAGVAGQNDAGGPGIWGSSSGNAGQFEGNVLVTGDLTAKDVILSGADCAEEFDGPQTEIIEAGSVVVFDSRGSLRPATEPYDKRVAGVISGAGSFSPGVVLDRRATSRTRIPLALAGKVYCKVDASFGPIEVGDMLTTSPSEGYAMKAGDRSMAFGAVIGKSLENLDRGRSLIQILILMA